MLNVGNATLRAKDAWRRIEDNPTVISIKRDATIVADQTVRIEHRVNITEKGEMVTSAVRGVTVFGVTGHPDIADTDIRRGDKFLVNGMAYRVIDVVPLRGQVQARCEAVI